MTITTDLGEKTITELKNIEGVHLNETTSLDDLQKSLQDIITLITGISDPGALQKDVEGKVKGIVGNKDEGDGADKKGAKGKEDQPTSGKLDVKVNDLNGMPQKFTIGALLVNSTLVKMQKTLEAIANKVGKAGNQSAKGLIASNKQVNNTKNVEKETNINIDPKKMDGITKALLQFGKACIILSLIPRKAVQKATDLYQNFMYKMAAISIEVAKYGGDLEKMGKGVKDIVGSMKTFAIGCILMAITLPMAVIAVSLGLPLMKRFIKGIADAASKLKPQQLHEIKNLGFFMVLVGVAVAIFTLDIILLEKVFPKLPKAIIGLFTFIAFITIMIFVSLLAKIGSKVIWSLAGFSIALSLSLILFNIALKMLFAIKIDKEKIDSFVTNIYNLAIGFLKAALPLLGAIIGAFLLGVFSILLAIGTLALMVALVLMFVANKLIELLAKDPVKTELGEEWQVIHSIKLLVKQFADPTFILFLIGSVPAVLLFAVFSILLAVASICFLIAAVMLFLTSFLLKKLIEGEGKDAHAPVVTGAAILAKEFAKNIGWFLLGAIALVPATVFAVLLLVFSLAMLISTVALVAINAIARKMDEKELKQSGKNLRAMSIGMMLRFLGIDDDEITVGNLIKGGINAVKMAALAAEALLAVIPTAIFMVALVTITAAFKTLESNMADIKPETITKVMEGVGLIMEQLATVSASFKGQSAKTIAAVGELVKDVATAISMLTDVVLKLKDGISKEQIDNATTAIKNICARLFGDPNQPEDTTATEGNYTIITVLQTMANKKLKKVRGEAVAALSPLIDAIGKLVDLVKTTADIDQGVVDQGVENLTKVTGLMDTIAGVMLNLVTKHKTGWFSSASPLSAAEDVVNEDFFGKLNTVFNQMNENQEIVAKIKPENYEALTTFMTDQALLTSGDGAKAFKNILKNVSSGLDDLTEKGVNNFRKLMDVFNNSDVNKVNDTLNALSKLAQFATQFKSTADSFERMAKAIEKMGKSEGKISKMFESLKEGAKASADLEKSTAAATGGTTFDPYVEKIYDIISDWNEMGIPIRGDEKGQIAPIPAGNSVGGGSSRK